MATVLNREATIKTAVVEIKALTVSGKQVTQAVFRQIPEEEIIALRDPGNSTIGDDYELAGTPWGWVNYHLGCSQREAWKNEHLHVIWQKGNELRRCVIYPDGFGSGVYEAMWYEDPEDEAFKEKEWEYYYFFLSQLDQLFIAV